MTRKQDTWLVLRCTGCKARVSDAQRCCNRYLCDDCHMKLCAIAPKQAEIERLRRLARNLHIALNQVLAGETLPPERKENLDENVSVYLGSNYESVVEEKW